MCILQLKNDQLFLFNYAYQINIAFLLLNTLGRRKKEIINQTSKQLKHHQKPIQGAAGLPEKRVNRVMTIENVTYGMFVSIVEDQVDRFIHIYENNSVEIDAFLNKYNWTSLQTAAYTGNEALVTYLTQRGANLSLTNKRGLTAMDMAIQSGHLHLVDMLNPNGQSALPNPYNNQVGPKFEDDSEENDTKYISYDSE